VRGKKATLFVVEGGVAKSLAVAVLGESGGSLFVDATLKPGALVVTEGRALLINGDRVTFATEKDAANSARVASPSAETGAVKP
jgi:hypothetical protein